MRVSVVYALPDAVWERSVELEEGASLRAAIARAGFAQAHPALAGKPLEVGVFGKRRALDDPLHEGDRVEIYRPLTVDPKQARRIRAEIRRRASKGA